MNSSTAGPGLEVHLVDVHGALVVHVHADSRVLVPHRQPDRLTVLDLRLALASFDQPSLLTFREA